jgi:hypothetical protein
MASFSHPMMQCRIAYPRWVGLLLALGTLAGLSGCASARYVERQADSGVVAIPENSNHWPTYYRQAALNLITQHVGPHYEILEEREVVVGQQTNNNQQVGPDFLAGITTTRELTEWRIAYRRAANPHYPSVGGHTRVSPPTGSRPVTHGSTQAGGNTVQPAGGVPATSGGATGLIPSVAPPPTGHTIGQGR